MRLIRLLSSFLHVILFDKECDMYYVIKNQEQYLGLPKNESYNAEIKNWVRDIDEAKVGNYYEMNRLAKRVVRSGTIQIIKVRLFEM